jgi:hypothetical protein
MADPADDMAAGDLYPRGFFGEPALADLLCDPIAEALMVADHVGNRDLEALLETARRHLSLRYTRPATP